ncbi:MIEF1 upstream open reading frame protein-like [Penaeus chinensis]|uniref:MIEF1 upstream open reading frame protein-like n=1 Tax=Penaeus chinensis TaxID=139456 RepID=UPI001FB71072|nr:MIEF1 upstream open reading frame protein-like [Penaeus chinensis]
MMKKKTGTQPKQGRQTTLDFKFISTSKQFQECNMSSSPSRQQVLQLYRALLQYGRTLEFTDQDYFMQRIRKEFQKNKTLVSSEEKQFYFGKGLSFLSKQRLI